MPLTNETLLFAEVETGAALGDNGNIGVYPFIVTQGLKGICLFFMGEGHLCGAHYFQHLLTITVDKHRGLCLLWKKIEEHHLVIEDQFY